MNDLIVRVLKINIYVFWPVFEGYYVIMQSLDNDHYIKTFFSFVAIIIIIVTKFWPKIANFEILLQ